MVRKTLYWVGIVFVCAVLITIAFFTKLSENQTLSAILWWTRQGIFFAAVVIFIYHIKLVHDLKNEFANKDDDCEDMPDEYIEIKDTNSGKTGEQDESAG